jgi:hypothetical protein
MAGLYLLMGAMSILLFRLVFAAIDSRHRQAAAGSASARFLF